MKDKILVIAPAWVGDMVMSQTLLKMLLANYHSNIEIHILVNNWAKDLAKRMPEISHVFINPFNHGEFKLIRRIKFGRALRQCRYSQVFVLPNSFKSAIIPFFAKIQKRIGFVGEFRYGLLNKTYKLNKQALPLMIERFCALINNGNKPNNIPYPKLSIDIINQKKLIYQLGLNLDKPIVCLCPAAEYGPAKRWPTKHFASLANGLAINGYQTWILGSNKDIAIAQEIMALAQENINLYNLCGKTSLVDVIDLIVLAKVAVSNDSGLMHIACAVDIPVIALYGSSSPAFTPPLSDKAQIVKIEIACAPCFERTCKYGHYDCLNNIMPKTILEKILTT